MRTLLLLGMCAALAGCETVPEQRWPSPEELTVSFTGICNQVRHKAENPLGLDFEEPDGFWASVLADRAAGTMAFDKCIAGEIAAYYADRTAAEQNRAADQNRRAALAGALLQSGAIAPRPAAPVYQIPVQPAPAAVILPPINCTTTAGPNTGPFGVVTSNTTCR